MTRKNSGSNLHAKKSCIIWGIFNLGAVLAIKWHQATISVDFWLPPPPFIYTFILLILKTKSALLLLSMHPWPPTSPNKSRKKIKILFYLCFHSWELQSPRAGLTKLPSAAASETRCSAPDAAASAGGLGRRASSGCRRGSSPHASSPWGTWPAWPVIPGWNSRRKMEVNLKVETRVPGNFFFFFFLYCAEPPGIYSHICGTCRLSCQSCASSMRLKA